jgi:hypothetical protein
MDAVLLAAMVPDASPTGAIDRPEGIRGLGLILTVHPRS